MRYASAEGITISGAPDRGGITARGNLRPTDAEGDDMTDLLQTPLHAFHIEHGAKMVPFAGYDMPVQYAAGVMKEHSQTRENAGLFDVSHMGQVIVRGNPCARADPYTPKGVQITELQIILHPKTGQDFVDVG